MLEFKRSLFVAPKIVPLVAATCASSPSPRQGQTHSSVSIDSISSASSEQTLIIARLGDGGRDRVTAIKSGESQDIA